MTNRIIPIPMAGGGSGTQGAQGAQGKHHHCDEALDGSVLQAAGEGERHAVPDNDQ